MLHPTQKNSVTPEEVLPEEADPVLIGFLEGPVPDVSRAVHAATRLSTDGVLTQASQPTHGILRKLLHDLDLSRRAGLKVSHRIPLRFL